jgi:hypothetical protein
VGLLNAFGFFDQLLAFNRHMTEVGFVREAHARIVIARATLGDLLGAMEGYEPHRPIFTMKAQDL